MTQLLDAPAEPRATVSWPRAAQLVRIALVLGWVVIAGLVAVVGSRESSFADLERAVAAGQVDAVTVDGGLRPGSTGYATVRVTWRDGLVADTTEVGEMRHAGPTGNALDVTAVLHGSVAERLHRIDPDVRVSTDARQSRTWIAGRWSIPGWASVPTTLMFVATLLFVVASPPPVRCTRWAGFWLFASGPVGLAAYLALVGPLRGLRGRWRLSGGWTFLAFLVLREVSGW